MEHAGLHSAQPLDYLTQLLQPILTLRALSFVVGRLGIYGPRCVIHRKRCERLCGSHESSFIGVSDLRQLYDFTHKFESRYPSKLVSGTPEEIPEIYKARPLVYHVDNIILQGEIHLFVPKAQAEAIYESIKQRGGVVEYKLHPEEGHAWRKEETMHAAFERELAFQLKEA